MGERHGTSYKAVVHWQFSSPLGAGNRVRLPACVVRAIRRRFPNPVCCAECDFWSECERLGHYTGFRTAEESRAYRDGQFSDINIE